MTGFAMAEDFIQRQAEEATNWRIPARPELCKGQLIVLYGTLMGYKGEQLKYKRDCLLHGKILNIGSFPGFVENAEGECYITHGELYEIVDTDIIDQFDPYEGYDPERHDESFYRREYRYLARPNNLSAWVYVWNGDQDFDVVPNGNWRDFNAVRND